MKFVEIGKLPRIIICQAKYNGREYEHDNLRSDK